MKILFAISVLSFCLLLWAAVAVTRHIRRSHSSGSSVVEPGLADQTVLHIESSVPTTAELIDSIASGRPDRAQPVHRIRYASVTRRDREFTSSETAYSGFSDDSGHRPALKSIDRSIDRSPDSNVDAPATTH